MDAQCPTCGYRTGMGTFSEPGACPKCKTPLMLTGEFRAYTPEELKANWERRARAEDRARERGDR